MQLRIKRIYFVNDKMRLDICIQRVATISIDRSLNDMLHITEKDIICNEKYDILKMRDDNLIKSYAR